MSRKLLFLVVTGILIGTTPLIMGQGCPGPTDTGGGGGSDGGISADPNSGGGANGGTDGGSNGGSDGGSNGGTDGGSNGGTDGGSNGGTDGGTSTPTPTLEGTWAGQLTMTIRSATSTAGPVDIDDPSAVLMSKTVPLTMTYGPGGIPSNLPVTNSSADVTGTASVQAGQTSSTTTNGVTLTVTIQEATYSPTYTRVVLTTTVSGSATENGVTITMSATSTQTLEATLAADKTSTTWNQVTDSAAQVTATDGTATEGEWKAMKVEMYGNLARQ